MITNVPATVIRRTRPMINPERIPMKTRRTPTTMARDSRRLMMKSFTDFVTCSDCMYIGLSSIPTGLNASSSFSLAETALPMLTTFPPSTVEIPIANAGRVLNFILKL